MEPSRGGPFPYTPITRRPDFKWPGGKRLALWVIPNLESFGLDEKMPPGAGGSNGLIPDVHSGNDLRCVVAPADWVTRINRVANDEQTPVGH